MCLCLIRPEKIRQFYYDDFEFNSEPFYVGKGSEKRPYKHIKAVKYNWISPAYNVNPEKRRKISEILGMNLNPVVEIIQKSMGATEACKLEIDLIDKIGRINEKSGPLTNKTNGGDGAVGCMSEEVCLKMSENHADFSGNKNPSMEKPIGKMFVKKFLSETPVYIRVVITLCSGYIDLEKTLLIMEKSIQRRQRD